MNVKIILGIVIGATFSGVAMAIACYFAAINDHSGSFFGPASDWWELAVILGLGLGIVIGGLSAAIILGFKMSLLASVLFGAVVNFLIVAGFYIATNGLMSDSIKYWLYSLIPIGLVNGVIVSFFTSPQQPFK